MSQPGAVPIDIPEQVPNPAHPQYVPQETPTKPEKVPAEPVKVPEKVP
jgi:hypothetical protein